MKKYRFKNNVHSLEDAQSVGLLLEKHFPDNKVKPDKLVEIAKDRRSPLHKFFDWDDRSAASKYRLNQARQLISALYVEVDDGSQLRAYENLYIEELSSNAYVSTDEIKASPDLSQQVVELALRELSYWKLKYQNYSDYFGVVLSAIDEVERSIKGVKDEKESNTRRNSNTGSNTPNRVKTSKNNPRRSYATSR